MRSALATLLCLAIPPLAGCGGALTLQQQVTGEWVGRPETAAERVVREWPVAGAADAKADPDDPEVAAAAAAAPVTDLELDAGSVRVDLRLSERGGATISIPGQPELTGAWKITPLAGRRSVLELEANAAGGEPQRRRFDLELFRVGPGFTLRESGADRLFGRLIFTPAGAE